MRKSKKVSCAGWPRSVQAAACHEIEDGKKMHADHRVPLRVGGLHDAKNFQPLCGACNVRKLHQVDQKLAPLDIKRLVGKVYRPKIYTNESVETAERRLKWAVRARIRSLVQRGAYKKALIAKKKEVNGQWDVERAYKKGTEWIQKGDDKILDAAEPKK